MFVFAFRLAAALLLAVTVGVARSAAVSADIAIYGGTSAGVIAAVQAAQLGHAVVLIEPGRHLGGMSVEGLGGSDIDNHAGFRNSPAVGGLALEFHRRLADHYGRREAFEAMRRTGGKQPALWRFESHVAEGIFDTWCARPACACCVATGSRSGRAS